MTSPNTHRSRLNDDFVFLEFDDIPHETEGCPLNLPDTWYYVGQIVDISTTNFLRFRTVLADRTGRKIIAAWYLDNNEEQRMKGYVAKHFQLGSTLLIKRAVGKHFLDGTEGIRIEDADATVALPCSITELDKIDIRLQKLKLGEEDKRCDNCQADKCKDGSGKLKRCSKCSSSFYCGRDCQVKGWAKHKKECSAVVSLKSVMENYDQVTRHLRR
jgi:hypothetical protein